MVGFGDLPLVFSTVGEREAGRGVGGESDESGLSSQGLAEGLYRKKDGSINDTTTVPRILQLRRANNYNCEPLVSLDYWKKKIIAQSLLIQYSIYM